MDHCDLAALHAIFSDAQVMKYWSTLPHREIVQTRAFMDAVIGADPATSIEFVIEFQGRVIGRAGFWRLPEIGYLLHRDVWGQGFGSEAVAALLAHGFSHFGLSEAVADVDPDNTASLRLLAGLGFEETGRKKNTLQIGERWFDSVYLRLTRDQWNAKADG